MDTLHDIGGREGFGSVSWQKDTDDIAFHEDWQARSWAMCMSTFALWRGKPEIWTIDWFRHVRERMDPIDYLTLNYYDQWTQCLAATLIDNGTIKINELLPDVQFDDQDTSAAARTGPSPSSGSVAETAPAFEVGHAVRCKLTIPAFHTRLPAYVRGKVGIVEEYHGAEPLADASAAGVIKPEPLYTVGFDAADLWPEAQGRRDRVYVDAWESYLEPAN